MKHILKKLPFFLCFLLFFNCDEFRLSDSEIAAGLKEALTFGSKYALNKLGAKDGFLLDQAVKIGLPEDAATLVKAAANIPVLNTILKNLEEEFVLAINRAAEASITEVIPIVATAITDMTIQDARNILFSSNDYAATEYLHSKTYDPLCDVCGSVIEGFLNRDIVGNASVQDVWGRLTGYYNQVANLVPNLVTPIETDLSLYATQKTLDGVFLKVGDEELKIRTDASARVTDLLKKVFGELD